jgi:hypothetical protein
MSWLNIATSRRMAIALGTPLCALVLAGQAGGQLQTGVLTGQILSLDGSAAVGIRVGAMALPDPNVPVAKGSVVVSLAETDSAGRYRLGNIPPGRYFVVAGLMEAPTYYPGAQAAAGASVVLVAAGATVSDLDFALVRSPGVTVRGRITGLGNISPAVVRTLDIFLNRTDPRAALRTVIEADGSFEFQKVGPGTYRLTVLPDTNPAAVRTIVVENADVTGIEVPGPLMISGRVVIEGEGSLPINQNDPASQMSGLLFNARGSVGGAVGVVWADGTFAIPVVSGRDYRISFSRVPAGYQVKSMSYGNVDLLKESIRIDRPVSQEIQVTLRREARE